MYNVTDIRKWTHGLDICLDIISNIKESSACLVRLQKTIKEGFLLSNKLLEHHIKYGHVSEFAKIYKQATNLIPNNDTNIIDKSVYSSLLKEKQKFNNQVANLLQKNPRFSSFLQIWETNQKTQQKLDFSIFYSTLRPPFHKKEEKGMTKRSTLLKLGNIYANDNIKRPKSAPGFNNNCWVVEYKKNNIWCNKYFLDISKAYEFYEKNKTDKINEFIKNITLNMKLKTR